MNCPACRVPMKEYLYKERIPVDVCKKCRGVWFDQGEMNPFLSMWTATHPDLPDAPISLNRDITDPTCLDEAGRPCPRDHGAMKKYNFAYDSNVILDRCPTCEGVWVDKPEIRRLAVYMKGNPKLDRLGESVAEHVQKQQEFADMVEGVGRLHHGAGIRIFFPKIILPLRDNLESETPPIFTLLFILINVAVMALLCLPSVDISAVYAQFGFIPARIVEGYAYFTFLTAMFLHGGVLHLVGNMLFLWIFGDNIEDAFGHIAYVFVYLACGVAAVGLHLALYMDSTIPCIGASGAVAGIMGAYFVLYPSALIDTFVFGTVIKIPAFVYIGLWFLMQLGLTWLVGRDTQVGYAAHVGGLLAGVVLACGLRALRAANKHRPTA